MVSFSSPELCICKAGGTSQSPIDVDRVGEGLCRRCERNSEPGLGGRNGKEVIEVLDLSQGTETEGRHVPSLPAAKEDEARPQDLSHCGLERNPNLKTASKASPPVVSNAGRTPASELHPRQGTPVKPTSQMPPATQPLTPSSRPHARPQAPRVRKTPTSAFETSTYRVRTTPSSPTPVFRYPKLVHDGKESWRASKRKLTSESNDSPPKKIKRWLPTPRSEKPGKIKRWVPTPQQSGKASPGATGSQMDWENMLATPCPSPPPASRVAAPTKQTRATEARAGGQVNRDAGTPSTGCVCQ